MFSTVVFACMTVMSISYVFLSKFYKYKYFQYKRIHHTPTILDDHFDLIYSPGTHKRLLLLLNELVNILDKRGIKYWITGGSLLGWYRNRGIICYDDDVDICVPEDQLSKLSGMSTPGNLSELGTETRGVFKYKNRGYTEFIDIFIVSKTNDIYNLTGHAFRRWPTAYHKNPFPLTVVSFHNVDTLIPNDTEDYLERVYGKNFNEIAKQTHSHLHIPFVFWMNKKILSRDNEIKITDTIRKDMIQVSSMVRI